MMHCRPVIPGAVAAVLALSLGGCASPAPAARQTPDDAKPGMIALTAEPPVQHHERNRVREGRRGGQAGFALHRGSLIVQSRPLHESAANHCN